MRKISVCVPTFNRPEELHQLINTFFKQDYPNKELVVSDDSKNDLTKKLIKQIGSKSIKYFHNPESLGFAKNLLAAMKRATGEYLITIGDDDLFLDNHVLSDYVKVFEKYPSVGFVYSNQVQFSDKMEIEYIINFFNEDKMFKKGRESMENMWIRSIFIGGTGIRNTSKIDRMYPKEKMLHPQVEFIGKVINENDSYLIAKNHIGFRSHEDQIIFHALKNKKTINTGHHMTVELSEIFKKLKKRYKMDINFDFAARQLINLQLIMMFKEKSFVGAQEMERNYRRFCRISKVAKNSKKFKLAFLLAQILPAQVILNLRKLGLEVISVLERDKHTSYKKKLLSMIAG